jgi:hypothetical protein
MTAISAPRPEGQPRRVLRYRPVRKERFGMDITGRWLP